MDILICQQTFLNPTFWNFKKTFLALFTMTPMCFNNTKDCSRSVTWHLKRNLSSASWRLKSVSATPAQPSTADKTFNDMKWLFHHPLNWENEKLSCCGAVLSKAQLLLKDIEELLDWCTSTGSSQPRRSRRVRIFAAVGNISFPEGITGLDKVSKRPQIGMFSRWPLLSGHSVWASIIQPFKSSRKVWSVWWPCLTCFVTNFECWFLDDQTHSFNAFPSLSLTKWPTNAEGPVYLSSLSCCQCSQFMEWMCSMLVTLEFLNKNTKMWVMWHHGNCCFRC